MTEGRLRSLRWLVCGRKVQLGRRAAMERAERARDRGERCSAYRCPFVPVDKDAHWHIGRPPAMRTLELLAEHLRDRRS